MKKEQKAFIFDLDGTITQHNDLSHKRINNLLDLIIENKWLIFIVTARPIQLGKDEISDELYDEEYDIFTNGINKIIASKIHNYIIEKTNNSAIAWSNNILPIFNLSINVKSF